MSSGSSFSVDQAAKGDDHGGLWTDWRCHSQRLGAGGNFAAWLLVGLGFWSDFFLGHALCGWALWFEIVVKVEEGGLLDGMVEIERGGRVGSLGQLEPGTVG